MSSHSLLDFLRHLGTRRAYIFIGCIFTDGASRARFPGFPSFRIHNGERAAAFPLSCHIFTGHLCICLGLRRGKYSWYLKCFLSPGSPFIGQRSGSLTRDLALIGFRLNSSGRLESHSGFPLFQKAHFCLRRGRTCTL